MKPYSMEHIAKLAGYPGQKIRDESLDTFTFFVQLDFDDFEIELAVEILHYEPGGYSGVASAGHREILGPSIELGDAWTVPDGRYFELSRLQYEAAEEAAIRQIQSRPSVVFRKGEYIGEL